ncbi:LacI family DNA-binding transcriptional regulator [Cellulomonas bogoriensis]|uniref:LacI family DNA-binding transcriptional regulator n=1 Tax=Cellulomonas bogoriensis TaxID=301388 RepID=UPI000B184252|nr:LacI family DNA-binding transcriptional regulator [Cellulomonas bogoriensis]
MAREAGVSLATASRAINGSATRTVRPDLQERVLEAAARLRYSPDANAQAMARGRTSSVGLVVHDIADPYFAAIAAGVTRAADRMGLTVTLTSTQHDPAREPAHVELLRRQRARAVVVCGGRRDDEAANAAMRSALAEFRRAGGSVALVSQPLLGVSTVVIDNTGGAHALARALHGRGYRRFGVLAGPADHLTARDRVRGLLTALTGLGCPPHPDAVVASAFTRDGGQDAMGRLLDRGPAVDVVVAVNDVMALGALAAARERRVRVPRQVGVAGFDDIPTLRDVTPSLSTVHVPLVDIGEAATQLALGPAGPEPRLLHVAGSVVLRDSTPGPGAVS